jgi:hypothetical protein
MKDIILLCLMLFIFFWYSADKNVMDMEINDDMLSKILLLLIIFFIYNNISLLFLFLIFTLFVYFKGSAEFKTNIGNKIKTVVYTSPTEWFGFMKGFVQTYNPITLMFSKNIETFETDDDVSDEDDDVSVDSVESTESTKNIKENVVKKDTLTVPEKFKAPIQKSQASMSSMTEDLGLFAKLVDELDNKDLEKDFTETRNELSTTLNDNEKKLLDQLKVTQNDIEIGYENFIQKSSALGSQEMNQLKNTLNKIK